MSFHRSIRPRIQRRTPPVEPIGKVTKKTPSLNVGMPQTIVKDHVNDPAMKFSFKNEADNLDKIATKNAQDVIDALLAGVSGAVRASTGNSNAGTGQSSSNKLAWAKWNDELARRKLEDEQRARGLTGMQDSLANGGYRGNADELLALIAGMDATGQTNINSNYSTGMSNIGAGFDTAQGLTNQGFSKANQYLKDNPNNPYQSFQAQNTPVQNAMSQLLASLGVSNDPVAQQVQAENVASQQSQGAANDLTSLLSANAQRNDASRLSEMQMAQQLGNAGMSTARAGYESNASNVQQRALATLLTQIQGAKFDVEQDVGTRKQTLMDAIIAAGGIIPGAPSTPLLNQPPTMIDVLKRLVNNGANGRMTYAE